MKARYIILLVFLTVLSIGCSPSAPTGGVAVLEFTRPTAPKAPDAAPVQKEIKRTAAAVQSARRSAAAHKAQADEHIETIAKLRAVLIKDALPIQKRLAEAEKYAEKLDTEMQAMEQTNIALEMDLIAAQDAVEESEVARQKLEKEISDRDNFITTSEAWKDAALAHATSQQEALEESQKEAAKYQSFHDSRWGRWLKWGSAIAIAMIILTSAAWFALIAYLRSNPTALAARIAGSALSNY